MATVVPVVNACDVAAIALVLLVVLTANVALPEAVTVPALLAFGSLLGKVLAVELAVLV